MVLALTVCLVPAARAQTVTLTPSVPLDYWAGVNTSNSLTANSIAVAEAGGGATTNINLSLTGANGTTVFGTLTPNSFTNNGTSVLALSVTNAALGYYPLTVNASGDAVASTGFNLFVVPQWLNQATGSSGNWSDNSQWSGGAVPGSSDGVYIEHDIVGPSTNVVDISKTVQSLVYLGGPADDNTPATGVHTVIPLGNTLSVLGTNGFCVGQKVSQGNKVEYVFEGGGTLLVSNTAAQFSIMPSMPNTGRFLRADMSTLANLDVCVNQMAVGDMVANQYCPSGQSLADFILAQTNVIKATLTDDYNAPVFNTSISYNRQVQSINNGQNSNARFRLGTSTTFLADSLGIGLGNANGSGFGAFNNAIGPRMAFNSVNETNPTSTVVFRNTDGTSRMSLLAIGVDMGTNTAFSGNRGIMDLRGGIADMLVDQILLGQDRTNSANENGKEITGQLFFDWGKIDCNTCIVGNMKYTNNIDTSGKGLLGCLYVGTNGTMVVNSNLILGQTPANVTGFEAQAAAVSGQVEVDNVGTLRANQITVGQHSGNNAITVNTGGTLEVSNTVASGATRLSTLTVGSGGNLTLHMNGTNTLVYVTNLMASGGIINIASVTGASSFAHVISYAPGDGESASFIAGTVPAGYSATVFNNTTTHTIDVTLVVGTPKTLLWKGYVDNTWNNSTKNWLDTVTGLHTNFTTGDSVMFDDTGTYNNINVTEDVVPRQATGINGISMTNNTLAYVFSGSGGIRGAASFLKAGTNSVEIDNYTEVAAQVTQGTLTGSGTVGAVTVSPGAACSMLGGGNVLGNCDDYGSLINAGTIGGSLTVENGGTANNSGMINGALAMATGSYVFNSGTMSAIGTAVVTTNAMLVNDGIIYGSSLTVNGTLTDMVMGSADVSPGSINVGTLTINGLFNPGGDGNAIATTKVTDYDYSSGNQLGTPNGRVQLSAGSTTIFKYNSTNSQPYTKLLSQSQVYGPSQSGKAINGCTLIISNVGPTTFSAGQTFKLFGQYYNDGTPGNAGLNTTNSYPIILPPAPGPGLLWDMSQLYVSGTIGVLSATDPAQIYKLTNSTAVYAATTNIVTHLSWPSDKIGGWVQELNTTLTNGLSATNWFTPSGGYLTNMPNVSDIFITNTLVADPTAPGSAIFFRFVYP